ncbi:MAG TPA: nucleotide exchange factor GrpE [Tepidiformaceae bacterium]|nr:nucleotide exchange factor GrpE [Tepidiformaceae bacterium]
MQANDAERADDDAPEMVDKRASAHMNDEPAPPQPSGPTGHGDAVAEANAKADEYHRNWQRSAADFINYKRRVEQERGEMARLASAALIINLLPIYDDMDRAAHNVDANLAGLNWVQGVIAIQKKFGSLLESMGVAEVPAEGQQFDPALHEAVGRQPGEEGKVLHVVQKGYQLGDRVIRPAMVIVGEGSAGDP